MFSSPPPFGVSVMSPGGAIIDQTSSAAYISNHCRHNCLTQQAQASHWCSIVTLDEEMNNACLTHESRPRAVCPVHQRFQASALGHRRGCDPGAPLRQVP